MEKKDFQKKDLLVTLFLQERQAFFALNQKVGTFYEFSELQGKNKKSGGFEKKKV